MNTTSKNILLGQTQRVSLILVSLLLAICLFFFRAGMTSKLPLDQLARKSLSPETALNNGKPSIFEFYADWCIACKEMAPSMLNIYEEVGNQVDFVLLNVDNIRWKDLLEEYEVNGIPQLIFFDANGNLFGRTVGVRNEGELKEITNALLSDKEKFLFSSEETNFSPL